MSRIGKMPIALPSGVEVSVANSVATVKGPQGTLTLAIPEGIAVEIEGNVVNVTRANDLKQTKQLHGTTRANLNNMVIGVHTPYSKTLTMDGTGYKAEIKGNSLVIYAGYSHPFTFDIPEGIKVTPDQKSNAIFTISGIDKIKVGQFAAVVRDVRRPEPYLGHGIAYKGEHIRRKEGKKAGKK